MGYFASLLHPGEEKKKKKKKIAILSQAHVLGAWKPMFYCYLWSFFCKWLVINVTLVTLKNEVYGIQDQYCFTILNGNYLSFICVYSK